MNAYEIARAEATRVVEAAYRKAVAAGELPEGTIPPVAVETPKDSSNGDWASTFAMQCAKPLHMAPRKIAESIVANLDLEGSCFDTVTIAGPGFMNFTLNQGWYEQAVRGVFAMGENYGRTESKKPEKVMVEFVSANPVGPMHIGHGRWAALGDSLCRVMDHAGYEIQREFYINDHGSQMNTFGNSISTRYMQLADIIAKQGVDIDEAHKLLIADRDAFVADENDEHPETHPYQDNFAETLGKDSYGGDYIIDEAAEFWRTDGDKWVNADPHARPLPRRQLRLRSLVLRALAVCEGHRGRDRRHLRRRPRF